MCFLLRKKFFTLFSLEYRVSYSCVKLLSLLCGPNEILNRYLSRSSDYILQGRLTFSVLPTVSSRKMRLSFLILCKNQDDFYDFFLMTDWSTCVFMMTVLSDDVGWWANLGPLVSEKNDDTWREAPVLLNSMAAFWRAFVASEVYPLCWASVRPICRPLLCRSSAPR